MPKRTIYNIQPTGNGDWEVKKTGGERASNVYENKQEAIERGRELAKIPPLGQLRIKDSNGVMQTEYTYGDDPRRYIG